MNVLAAIDENGEVTRVALEAQIALEDGDTMRSAQLFRRAGEMLESSVARLEKASERDLARFLAATHYYKGGAYPEAARVCGRIQAGRLPSQVRHVFPSFLKDVKERSAPGYARRYAAIVADLYQRVTRDGDPAAAQGVIDLLIAHPYLLPRDRMAYMRARCCEVLGHRRATTLFLRDAWRFNPDNPHYPLAYLDSLCKEGKHEEAWEIAEDQLEEHPGARSSIYAMSVLSAILLRDLNATTTADEQIRQQRREELLRQFDSALQACQSMGSRERRAIASLIDHAFVIAWIPYMEVNGRTQLFEMIDRWIDWRPDSPRPREVRGMVAYPSESSNRDFGEAIRLGSSDPLPYYFLAHDALLARRFLECDRLCTQSLQRGPEPGTRATLLFWQAISRWNLGRDRADIRPLFDEATKLKPDDSLIADFARKFEENGRTAGPPSQVPSEDDRHWREQPQRFFNEYSMKRFEETIPTLDASFV